ncbi:MAG: hypothetical protein EBZ69_02220 [Alphaproteobacteria bacterium]|nr:hypothetical protein [Alphaproteobacteria bacterium]NDC55618.1 hypothetical protein [Alphaproteobacteria bacterium]NDG04005.1 hypothetical protein [Alphaproteobacteria bacterium]
MIKEKIKERIEELKYELFAVKAAGIGAVAASLVFNPWLLTLSVPLCLASFSYTRCRIYGYNAGGFFYYRGNYYEGTVSNAMYKASDSLVGWLMMTSAVSIMANIVIAHDSRVALDKAAREAAIGIMVQKSEPERSVFRHQGQTLTAVLQRHFVGKDGKRCVELSVEGDIGPFIDTPMWQRVSSWTTGGRNPSEVRHVGSVCYISAKS